MKNENKLAINWKQHRDKMREYWHSLNDADLDMIAGDRNVLASVLQEKYGFTEPTAQAEIDRYLQNAQAGKQPQSG